MDSCLENSPFAGEILFLRSIPKNVIRGKRILVVGADESTLKCR